MLIAGCGGSSGRNAKAETLTKVEFIERADQVCERTDATQRFAVRKYLANRPSATASQSSNEAAVLAVGLPAIKVEAKELDELPVPEGDEVEIKAIIDGVEKAVEKGEENPGELVNVKPGGGPFAAVGKLAREYGLDACAAPL